MSKIAHPRGKVIADVEFYRIYQKNSNSVTEVNGVKKERTSGTTISIYQGKKLVKDGFKNKEAAVSAAKELHKEHMLEVEKRKNK